MVAILGLIGLLHASANPPPISDTPPFFSPVEDQVIDEDTSSLPVPLLYGDAETPLSQLRLVAVSSNQQLVPDQNVLFNEAPKMVVVPAADQHGVTEITLSVEDAQGRRATQSFRLTVRPVNDPPRIKVNGPFTLLEDDRPQAIPFTVTDPDHDQLEVTVSSLNTAIIPDRNITIDGTGEDRLLTLRSAPDQHGAVSVAIVVRDPSGAETRQDLAVRVLPVNDPPLLQRLPDQRLAMNQTLGPIPLVVTDDETSPKNLVLEGLSSNPLLVSPANILFGGFEDKRTISVQPTRNMTGSALITVKAFDQARLETAMSFLLTVERENIPPDISALADVSAGQGETVGPIPFSVIDPDDNSDLVIVEATSLNTDLVLSSGIQLHGVGSERTITITPKSGASGTGEIAVTATDRHGGRSRVVFSITIRPPPSRPVASAATLSVVEDVAAEVVLDGLSPSGRPLTYTIVAPPQKGTLVGEAPRLTYMPNVNASGPDSFQFTVSDGIVQSLPGTISIVIQEVNDPPAISQIADRRSEPGKIAGPVRFSVSDSETPASGLIVSGRSSNPVLVSDSGILIVGAGDIRDLTILPAEGQTGVATITLTVRDGSGAVAVTAFELRVEEISGAPVGESQAVVTPEDVPIAISLRGRDAAGQVVSYAIVDAPIKGTLSGLPPNLVYRPNANENGQDRFTFKVSNSSGESPATTVDVLILPINDPPVARSQTHSLNEDVPLDLELTAQDPDRNPVTFEVVSFPTKGKLSGTAPRLTYTPDPNATGVDQFTFTAHDGELVSAQGTIRITLEPVNDPPVASPLFVSGMEDTAISVGLKAGDIDGDPLVYSIATLPAKGLLAGTPPDLVFIPNANANGLDRFTFKVSDGKLSSELAVVSVMVVPVNDGPVAESQFLSLAEDASVEILLGGRDLDNDPLSFAIVTPPANGSLSGTAPRLTYTPNPNFHGFDSFTFRVNDGVAESLPGTITISVRSVNDAPVAFDQFVTLAEDASHGLVLTGADADGGALTFSVVEGPKNGSVSGIPPNLTYTPLADFNGADRFTFRVSDGQLDSAPATVNISVRPINDAPRAENQFLTATRGQSRIVTLTGADSEGNALQFILTSLPVKGVLSGKPPDLIYHPEPAQAGLDSFTYKVSDGILESLPGTIQIALTERTSGPTISTIPDQVSRNGASTPKLPFTVGDAETAASDLVIAVSSSAPALISNTNVIVEGTGAQRTVQVTPNPGAVGTATVTLVVWDQDGLAASSQFAVSMIRQNLPPLADPATVTTLEDTPLVIQLNGADPDNDSLTYVVTSQPQKGRLSGEPPRLTYTPNANANGTDKLTFKVRDGVADSPEAEVTIQIQPVNDAPQVSVLADLVIEPNQSFGPVRLDVIDVESAPAELKLTVEFSAPELIAAGSGVFKFAEGHWTLAATAAPAKSGVTTVTVTASDGQATGRSSFQLTILPANDLPAVQLISPEDSTLLEYGVPIVLEAEASDPEGVQRVEFYAGPVLLGSDNAPPYEWIWDPDERGVYEVTAKAIDVRGGAAVSDAAQILVDNVKGRAAVFGDPADPDLLQMRKSLFGLSLQSEVFSREELGEQMMDFDLVIWHDTAAAQIATRELDQFELLASEAVPLYFLGDGLVSSGRQLPESERERWQSLIHLKPGGSSWLNRVEINSADGHPVIANGRAGSVAGFGYPIGPYQAAVRKGAAGEMVLVRSGSYDVVVASPHDQFYTRFVTHHLRLTRASDAKGLAEQIKLFENAVWWLLNKEYFMDLTLEVFAPEQSVVAGEPFQYRIHVSHSGESSANRVVVTDVLPAEITIQDTNLDRARWQFADGVATFQLGQFISAEEKEIVVTAIASQAGPFTHSLELELLGEDVNPENNDAISTIVIGAAPPKLGIQRDGEMVRLLLPQTDGTEYAIEVSDDLVRWTELEPSLYNAGSGTTFVTDPIRCRFFRLVRPDGTKLSD